jgi:hypothetical protein
MLSNGKGAVLRPLVLVFSPISFFAYPSPEPNWFRASFPIKRLENVPVDDETNLFILGDLENSYSL